MNLNITAPLLASICFWSIFFQVETLSEFASFECSRIHHDVANRYDLVIPTGEFLNRECTLRCAFASVRLKDDWINEEKPCPEDVLGICKNGKCVGGVDDARRDCGREFNIDFSTNSVGTVYNNSQCTLKCVLSGQVLSNEPRHEGAPCPANTKGVCRNGVCVKPGFLLKPTDLGTVL